MLTAHLTVKHCKFTKARLKVSKYGYIVENSKQKNRYTIYINSQYGLLETIGTLFHELTHFVLFTIFRDDVITSEMEERYCEMMDYYSKKKMTELIGGKTG